MNRWCSIPHGENLFVAQGEFPRGKDVTVELLMKLPDQKAQEARFTPYKEGATAQTKQ